MNPATPWARSFVDELIRAGVRHVCICPGSRSTPLVLAAAQREELRTYVHLDERSAGFFALGIGKVTGRPAGVITTSGTAVANLLPSVVEASQSETPLLLLTADRPEELHGTDANQTIDQRGIFGGHVRLEVAPGEPRADDQALARLRTKARLAVQASVTAPAGPVHVNLPFRKPLEPDNDQRVPAPTQEPHAAEPRDAASSSAGLVFRGVGPPPDPRMLEELTDWLRSGERGVIVCGPHPDPSRGGPSAVRLAAATGIPLLADPLSGARWGERGDAVVLGHYDAFLRSDEVRRRFRPDRVLRIGRSPTSATVGRWLAEHADVSQWVLDGGGRWRDHLGVVDRYVIADPGAALDGVIRLWGDVPTPEGTVTWGLSWARLEAETVRVMEGAHDEVFSEGTVAAILAEILPSGVPLMVSSSMPVRDLDTFGSPHERPLTVLGNRGASGIDGITSTGLGVSAGRGGPAVVLLGDIAFFHDLGGLLATRESRVDAVFVVIQNDGGGIFHMLPIREHEPWFTPYFATPHGLDVGRAAALFGLDHRAVDSAASLRAALHEALERGGSHILEVVSDRRKNEAWHTDLFQRVEAALSRFAQASSSASEA